jgi:cellulose synthase/poly-beta-1,6-N-acetylglucosamine synthase-like glycosyltransferase
MTTCVDQDFSWRAANTGATLGFAPGAVVQVRLRHSLRDCWRQAFGWGVGSVDLYARHRLRAEKAGPGLAILVLGAARVIWYLPRLVNALGRRAWISEAGLFAGRLRGLVKNRAFLL